MKSLSRARSAAAARSERGRAALGDGDGAPSIVVTPPGPRSRQLGESLAASEAPGVNTVSGGPSVVWAEAAGANVLDVDGNRYVDLTCGFGVAAIGHRHPRVVAAIAEQAGLLVHGLGDVAAHPARIELALRLQALAPMPDARVYFAVSGSDAVEIAWKTAVLATGRGGLLAFDPAYHGTSLGALALTSRPAFSTPFASIVAATTRRLPYGCTTGELDSVFDRHGETLGCVVLEPVVGREGVLFPPRGWLAAVAERARAHGVVVVADEIFTGFGRTGAMFAAAAEGVVADLVCCGKALGGGLPIAAVLGSAELLGRWDGSGEALHTGTFLAHPLSCAAALATLDVIEQEDLPARARTIGAWIEERVAPWRALEGVVEVRGRGMLWAVELADAAMARRTTQAALERGVLLLTCGEAGRTLQILPPLTIDRRQLATALDLVEAALMPVKPGPIGSRATAASPEPVRGAAVADASPSSPALAPPSAAGVTMIDLARAHAPLETELEAAFARVMRSGRFILGQEVEAFEREIAQSIGIAHAVGMSSGTDALLAALMTLDLEPGDEVLCPAFTFFATAGCVWRAGLRPSFADVSARSFNSGREELESRIGPRTRAIVVVHLFGRLAEMDPILELARSRGLRVIEDAAQAIGASDSGRQAGTFAEIGCFSFFPTKNLGALGDGGLATTASAERAERLRVLRNLGQSSRYVHDTVSGNFRLDALQAALLRVKLPHVAEANERRHRVAARYDALFAGAGLAVPTASAGGIAGGATADFATPDGAPRLDDDPPLVLPQPAGAAHVFHQYVIRVTRSGWRDALRQHLAAAGVETQVYYPVPLHLQPCFRELGYRPGDLPVAERLAGEVLALPMHPDLDASAQARVVELIASFVAGPTGP